INGWTLLPDYKTSCSQGIWNLTSLSSCQPSLEADPRDVALESPLLINNCFDFGDGRSIWKALQAGAIISTKPNR
ncbi:hypothetical protein JMJ77_0005990, partial [Colletotrichum scovillei]